MKHMKPLSKTPQPGNLPIYAQFEQKLNTKINTINTKAGSLG